MKTIGVIGAGTMGRGVAQVFAESGYKVVLIDIRQDALDEAKSFVYNMLRLQPIINKELSNNDIDRVMKNIDFCCTYKELETCDYIIENIPENLTLKKELYKEINKFYREDCLIAINTSCLSITQLSRYLRKQSNVVGVHFMNPVNLIKAVELIRGYHTSKKTIKEIEMLIRTIGKESILVNDFPGFVSNRISHIYINEAAFVVQDQVAGVKEVDDIFKKCYGHKMGPLETADLIGIDTVVDSLEVLYRSYQDPKYRCCPLLKKMVYAGKLGRKTNKGFYSYI